MDYVTIDVAQQEYSNNKCYASGFRYIYIYLIIIRTLHGFSFRCVLRKYKA